MKTKIEIGTVLKELRPDAELATETVSSRGFRVIQINPEFKTEVVSFYHGFGWLTDDKWSRLRQADPRLAP